MVRARYVFPVPGRPVSSRELPARQWFHLRCLGRSASMRGARWLQDALLRAEPGSKGKGKNNRSERDLRDERKLTNEGEEALPAVAFPFHSYSFLLSFSFVFLVFWLLIKKK